MNFLYIEMECIAFTRRLNHTWWMWMKLRVFFICCCVCCQFGWPYRLIRNDFSISQNWTRKRSNKTDEKNRYLKVVCNADSSMQITYISYTDTALCTYLTPSDFSLPLIISFSFFLSLSPRLHVFGFTFGLSCDITDS